MTPQQKGKEHQEQQQHQQQGQEHQEEQQQYEQGTPLDLVLCCAGDSSRLVFWDLRYSIASKSISSMVQSLTRSLVCIVIVV